jgi:PAS domain S-box-containing protein
MSRAGRERDRVRALIDDLEAAVWEADAAGRFTFVSEGARRLLGVSPEAWLSPGFLRERIDPDDRRATLGAIESSMDAGRPFDLQFRLRRDDGSTAWVRALGRPLPDGDGSRGLLLDVGRQMLEEERRSELELRYQRLIEHLPAIVYTESVTDDEAGVIYVSPQIRTILGIDPAEWIGTSAGWLARVHRDDRARVEAANARSDATGEPFAAEYRVLAADGREVWFHDESVLVRDDDGRARFWQGVMLDVTEQRRATELEAALVSERAATDALREIDEMKNTFLQAVSHDLRTPLAAIVGLALTLERDDVELSAQEARDFATRIASNARKLDRIVTDLLDLDRIGRGDVHPDLRATDVGALVARVVAESDALADREVMVDATPATAEVDPPKLERIVDNLLANTVRHTPPGTRVWVRVRSEGEGVEIDVEDDGPGIAPDLREAVFEPFNRGGATLEHGAGVGIGLALVQRFAQLHGGRAWVEERDGGGASFRVWLPARHGSAAAARAGVVPAV